MNKFTLLLVLGCLLGVSMAGPLRNLMTHGITYPVKPDDRPHHRRYFSDKDYNMWCTPRPINTGNLTCSDNSYVEDAWKKDIHCGRMNAYDHHDVGKIWNKAIGDAEYETGNIEEISCISAATMHFTGIYSCPSFETTADLIHEHNDLFNLGMSDDQVLGMANEQVAKVVANFDYIRDCAPHTKYVPQVIPGSKLQCHAGFVRSNTEFFASDAEKVANAPLQELYDHLINSFDNCGEHHEGMEGTAGATVFEGENLFWIREDDYHYYFVLYLDEVTGNEYEIYITADRNHGAMFGPGIYDNEEIQGILRWSYAELCPFPYVETRPADLSTTQLGEFYNRHPSGIDWDSVCFYEVEGETTYESFHYIPFIDEAGYFKAENGTTVEEWNLHGNPL